MGHGSSKPGVTEPTDDSTDGSKGSSSRLSSLKQRLHVHRLRSHGHRKGDSTSGHLKLHSAEDFAGIALVKLVSAEMKFKDKWMACISFGEQTCRTEKKLLLERNGPRVARITVFETNRLSKNNLIGYCEVDIFEFLTQDTDSDVEVLNLLDPSSPEIVVGNISLSCSVEDPSETQKSFARRILSIVDYNDDGKLTFSEFSDLINAFGNKLAADKKEELFKAADLNGDGVVSMDELASLLAIRQEKLVSSHDYVVCIHLSLVVLREPLINCCPVCGEFLEPSDGLNNMIHLTLCFDEGTGHQVFDRSSKRLVEELIDGKIVLSMRALYQSRIGLQLMDKGAKELLQSISEKQGKKMGSVESAKDIPKMFLLLGLSFSEDQIKMAEVKYPLEHFKTFNEFFIRELKPGARPIACMEHDDVAVCGADSRLMAFQNVEDSLRFWIKCQKFSVQGLLGKESSSNAFTNGSLVIFRLAPQDYHRFHLPVSGTIEKFVDIPGCLYTVNPIAVNSKYCNVFTENKRVVAFIAIGATMVGSITFTKKKGDYVRKGDEDSIKIDKDLLEKSARSLETLVAVGMTLGVSKKKHPEVRLPNLDKCVLQA
ncbi:hypothetical protein RHSIM_Rhsim11G0134200 [Rhododendron simsii]|uniref:EF-hand domain-containing protein n=1 Tax=Rhododendron simsii TaxID=118357 RepID=A0A834G8B9_RHOSS|nr:hypothetical protein RHSIM_Rhsim11G0134200 [Rhododendron simsii]